MKFSHSINLTLKIRVSTHLQVKQEEFKCVDASHKCLAFLGRSEKLSQLLRWKPMHLGSRLLCLTPFLPTQDHKLQSKRQVQHLTSTKGA